MEEELLSGPVAPEATSEKMLQILSGLAPRDPAAANPATTAAMARSRDAITRTLQRQMARQEEPFSGINDVATAAITALASRHKTPFGSALAKLDADRDNSTIRTASALGQQAQRESKTGIDPIRAANLIMRQIEHGVRNNDRDSREIDSFVKTLSSNMEPMSALRFQSSYTKAIFEHLNATGTTKLEVPEIKMLLSDFAQRGGFQAGRGDSSKERMINELAGMRERLRSGQPMSSYERDRMLAIENELRKITPIGEQGILTRDAMPGMPTAAQPQSFRGAPADMEPLFRQVSQETGVPPDILQKIAFIESRYNAGAVSPKGALGVMQVMPATGAEMGYSPEQLNDPAQNIRAGAQYFRKMLDMFGGNPVLAAIAYNGGPQRAQQFIQSGGDWSVLPQETARYAGMFLTSGVGPQQGPPQGQAGDSRRQGLSNLPPGTTVTVPPASKPLPAATQEDLQSISIFAGAMPALEKGLKKSVPIIGHAFEKASKYGLWDDPDIREFEGALNTLRVQAQSIVKGTPSNFDIKTVTEMFPNLGYSKKTNEVRVQFLKEAFGEALKIRLGAYMAANSNFNIPSTIVDAAKKLGVSISELRPITPDEAERRWQQWDATMNTARNLFSESASQQPGAGDAAEARKQELKKKYKLD